MINDLKNFENEVRNKYSLLVKELINKNLTITFMESATGGQLASLISDNEGSSAIFKGSMVTYSNEAKIKQGVDTLLIEKYTVYSKQVALSMANAVNKIYPSDIAIGVTGQFNNVDPANKVGKTNQIYFAITYQNKEYTYFYQIKSQENRLLAKLEVANVIYQELIKLI